MEQDIQTYIEDKIDAYIQRKDTANTILHELVSRSECNFQWVVLVISQVLKAHKGRKSLKSIQTIIRDTPAELHDLYTVLLSCIEKQERVQSLHLMQWICFH